MVGWHHRVNGLKFEQALRVGDGQGSLACYSLQDHKESDMTEQEKSIELATPQAYRKHVATLSALRRADLIIGA